MRKIISTIIFAAVFAVAVSCSCGREDDDKTAQVQVECGNEEGKSGGICLDSLRCVEGQVKKGQFFSNLLTSLGMSAQEAYELTVACGGVFDVKTLRVGNSYKAYYPADGSSPVYLIYEKDRTSNVVFSCCSPYGAQIEEKSVSVVQRYADVTIQNSLWVDMRNAGVSPHLIMDLSEIYAWTVDFFGLQKGDRFKVLYDEKMCDGEVVAIDTVRYAVFSRGSNDLPMVMYNQHDGGNIWWNDKGESMRKAFLKAPLKFSRISSGFSYSRKHPVTRKVQPHTGVDYAAPKGTPVMTIGDGVITSMKYEGAGGNTIRIKHNSIYSTAYLHLSGYAKGLKVGQRVRQGEVIGYVGSTGRSTGPHLDFRVWKNGTPINPLKMESPPAEPVKKENLKEFETAYEKYKAQIDTIQARVIAAELFRLL